MSEAGIDAATARVAALRARRSPVVVAIDGRSGTGKSTFARELARRLDAPAIDGDAFYAGGTGLRDDLPSERAQACIDRAALAAVLETLRAGRGATYRPFDWDAFDGRRVAPPVHVPATGTLVLEGVYTCHPELRPLLDLRILLRCTDEERHRRLLAREGPPGAWERQWHDAEAWYFAHLMPAASFDLVIDT